MKVFAFAALAISAALLGCGKAAGPPRPEAGPAAARRPGPGLSPPIHSASPGVGITWTDPPGLPRARPTSSAQTASYVVPRAAGDAEDGELAVFRVEPGEGAGGDDIERWVELFPAVASSAVKRSDREINGLHVRAVEIQRGTFDARRTSPRSSRPKTDYARDYALEGAIVEGSRGAYLFRMTGPAHTVAAGRAAFRQLLESVRIVRPER